MIIIRSSKNSESGIVAIQLLLILAMCVVVTVMVLRHWRAFDSTKTWRQKNSWITAIINSGKQYVKKHQHLTHFTIDYICTPKTEHEVLCKALEQHRLFFHVNGKHELIFDIPSVPKHICVKYQHYWRDYDSHCILHHKQELLWFHLKVTIK